MSQLVFVSFGVPLGGFVEFGCSLCLSSVVVPSHCRCFACMWFSPLLVTQSCLWWSVGVQRLG